MKLNNDANFSIIVNKECNLSCDYCTGMSPTEQAPDFKKRLKEILIHKSDYLYQCSITGGEPGLCEDLPEILLLIEKYGNFSKVVYTTNGTNLIKLLPFMKGIVNHINISVHPKAKSLYNDLPEMCIKANELGIDITLVQVVNEDNLNLTMIGESINEAKEVGASALSFRRNSHDNTLEYNSVVDLLKKKYVPIGEGSCPVCRSISFLIFGTKVTFKASLNEPSEVMEDEIYEFIVHPNGKLYIDWQGTKEFNMDEDMRTLSLEKLHELASRNCSTGVLFFKEHPELPRTDRIKKNIQQNVKNTEYIKSLSTSPSNRSIADKIEENMSNPDYVKCHGEKKAKEVYKQEIINEYKKGGSCYSSPSRGCGSRNISSGGCGSIGGC